MTAKLSDKVEIVLLCCAIALFFAICLEVARG